MVNEQAKEDPPRLDSEADLEQEQSDAIRPGMRAIVINQLS